MNLLYDGPGDAETTLVLAHGAGAPMDSPFMQNMATAVAACDLRVVRFEFPYMADRRRGTRRGPDPAAVLVRSWNEVIVAIGDPSRLMIGGKSMGGRIASMIADETGVAGLVCLGYPFHPPGRPASLRTSHLEALKTRTLIVQGERDPLGSREEVAAYPLSPAIRVEWLPDGDHSFKPRKKSGHTTEGNLAAAVDLVVRFCRSVARPGR